MASTACGAGVASLRPPQQQRVATRRARTVRVLAVASPVKPASKPAAKVAPIGKEEAATLYKDMVLGREFEEMCAQMYYRGKMFGFVHLYSGQEAVSTGAPAAACRRPACRRRILLSPLLAAAAMRSQIHPPGCWHGGGKGQGAAAPCCPSCSLSSRPPALLPPSPVLPGRRRHQGQPA